MDKTIEVVLVAVVVIATAAIMLFIFSGESGTFSDFISNSISDANETLENSQGSSNSCSPPCQAGEYCEGGTCIPQAIS